MKELQARMKAAQEEKKEIVINNPLPDTKEELEALLNGPEMLSTEMAEAGATNAAVMTAQILAVSEPAVADKLKDYKRLLIEKVERAAERLGT